MESVKFELTIKKFFEKAGVVLLKKGIDYTGGDDVASFMLLDMKRKSFYLTETDIPDDTDFEINAVSQYLNANMPANVKAAVLRLGRADAREYIPMPELFSLEGLVRKTALIISESDAPRVSEYLGSLSAVFQSVPFKGSFMVYFFDGANSKKLIAAYKAASAALREGGKEEKAPDAAEVLTAISEPSAVNNDVLDTAPESPALSFDNLISDVPAAEQGKTDINESDAEDLLANIDLSKLIPPPTEQEPESQQEADLMYAKILNEQSATNEVSLAGPREHSRSEIPKGIITEFQSEGVLPKYTDSPEDENPERELLQKKDVYEPKPKKAAVGAKKRLVRNLACSAAGLIFFTPAYILGKICSRFFPPFVVYWLAAIAVIFGATHYIWMFPGGMLYDSLLGTGAAQSGQLISFASQMADGDAAKGLVSFSGIIFAGIVAAADGLSSGWLLRYLAAFGAVMMIFPYGREFGARITVFSLLFYFVAPLMITAQTFAISSALAMFVVQPEGLSAVAAGIFASVFFIPVVTVVVLLVISGWITPEKMKCETEVLP